MKKSIIPTKLTLRHETLKVLGSDSLKLLAGAGPVRTRDLPCVELTAKDCG